MTALTTSARFDRRFLLRLTDRLALAVAIVLPWSTSATAIGVAAWAVVVLPTLDAASVRRELGTAAGGLPVLLWLLGAIGMLWADVGRGERLAGHGGFNRLLLVPLLLAHFRRSEHGDRIIYGFLASSACVLAASYFLVLAPGLTWRGNVLGVPVHDDIFQGSEFLVCAFATAGVAWHDYRSRRRTAALALIVLSALFLLNFTFSVVSRTSLVVAPLLAALLGWREMRWKGVASVRDRAKICWHRRNLVEPFLSTICPLLIVSGICLEFLYPVFGISKLIRKLCSDIARLLEVCLSRVSRSVN